MSLELPFGIILRSANSLRNLVVVRNKYKRSSGISLILLYYFTEIMFRMFSIVGINFELISVYILAILFKAIERFLIF